MRIDKRLNLVIPIYEDDKATKILCYAHSTPVSAEVWDTYWEVMDAAFVAINTGGHGMAGGPKIALKMLQKVATNMGVWEGETGVQAGLITEIHRLTHIIMVGKRGWETLPFDQGKKNLPAEDVREIEGRIVFFTLGWHGYPREIRFTMLSGAMSLYGSQIESLNCTEYMNSLPTPIAAVSTGGTAAA